MAPKPVDLMQHPHNADPYEFYRNNDTITIKKIDTNLLTRELKKGKDRYSHLALNRPS